VNAGRSSYGYGPGEESWRDRDALARRDAAIGTRVAGVVSRGVAPPECVKAGEDGHEAGNCIECLVWAGWQAAQAKRRREHGLGIDQAGPT
jgi:hypothetical protein